MHCQQEFMLIHSVVHNICFWNSNVENLLFFSSSTCRNWNIILVYVYRSFCSYYGLSFSSCMWNVHVPWLCATVSSIFGINSDVAQKRCWECIQVSIPDGFYSLSFSLLIPLLFGVCVAEVDEIPVPKVAFPVRI